MAGIIQQSSLKESVDGSRLPNIGQAAYDNRTAALGIHSPGLVTWRVPEFCAALRNWACGFVAPPVAWKATRRFCRGDVRHDNGRNLTQASLEERRGRSLGCGHDPYQA